MKPLAQARHCGELFSLLADTWPDKLALETLQGQPRTFAELNQRTNRLSHALTALGLDKGDRVAIVAHNCAEYIEVFGVSKTGAVVVPLNWRLAPTELLRLLAHCAPKVVVVDQQHRLVVESMKAALPQVQQWVLIGDSAPGWIGFEDLLAGASSDDVGVSLQGKDPL